MRWALAILHAAARCVLNVSSAAFAGSMRPAPVCAGSGTKQTMDQFRHVTGSLRMIQRSQVSAREKDRILEVKVR